MTMFKKDNVIIRENDPRKQKELLARDFKKVTEEDLKPKKAAKAKKEDKKGE